jgi:Holliday junction resolvase RusA-like endonuclease
MRIVLPHLPPSKAYPNKKTHYFTLSSIRREQQEEMIAYVLEQGRPDTPYDKAHITLTWRSKDKRNRDVDNLLSAMKGSIDGLIHGGVIVDDSAKHLSYTLYYEWGDKVKENQTILDIKEVREV